MGNTWIDDLDDKWSIRDREEQRARASAEKTAQQLREDAGINWEQIVKLIRGDVGAFNSHLRRRTPHGATELRIRSEPSNTLVVFAEMPNISVRVQMPEHGRHLHVETNVMRVHEEGSDTRFHVRLREDANQRLSFWNEEEERWDMWDSVSKNMFSVFVGVMKLAPEEF